MFESLEARRMLSGVWSDQGGTTIIVNGSKEADVIRVSRHGDRLLIELNDVRRWFDRSKIGSVQISGSGGDDLITGERAGVRLQALGGPGNDTLIGGSGNDHLWGSDGSDRLIGNLGDDDLAGEGGRDLMTGGAGADTIDGGGADDLLWGNEGEDFFRAYVGNDTVDGGDDPDVAQHYADQGDLISIEGETLVSAGPHPDPYTHVGATRRKDGKIVVTVTATHFSGGWERVLGDVSRNGRTFSAFVMGIDHAGPNGVRTAALQTAQKTYILGQLADGTYTFKAGNDARLLATLQITVSGGMLVNTVSWNGPWTPSQIIFEPARG